MAFSEVLDITGREVGQLRGDLAFLSRLTKAQFGRTNWPVAAVWAAGGEQQMYYHMSRANDEIWQRLRDTPGVDAEVAELRE